MISVVIPVYKKIDEFIKNLEQNHSLLKECEIIVVNDDPSLSIRSRLEKYELQLVENPKNLGFAGAIDIGIKKAKYNLVFLLNSDVKLLDSSFLSSIRKFKKDSKLFAISFAQKESDGSIVGKNQLFWKNGLLNHSKANNLDEGETAWAEGGSSIIRKDIYEKIGGFDTIFSPFYWEDIELSYRARKYGYTSWFDPSVLVSHGHETTIGSYWSKRAIAVISTRNQLLCSWKYVQAKNVIWHMTNVIYQALLSLVRGNFIFAEGLVKAIPFLFSPKFYKVR